MKILTKFTLTKYNDMIRLNISKLDSFNLKKETIKLPVMYRKWCRIS
jgi:hypothetical protein